MGIYFCRLQPKRYVNFVTKFRKQLAVQGYLMHIKQRWKIFVKEDIHWFDKVINIQCLETFEVMIIINYKTLKYSPGIAPEELSERCWDVWDHSMDMTCTSRRCPMTSHTFSVPVFSSSFEFFLLLHYRQAKCIIYCLTLNPSHGFILMKNAAKQK